MPLFFLPILEGRAEILTIILLLFWKIEDATILFWDYLTFMYIQLSIVTEYTRRPKHQCLQSLTNLSILWKIESFKDTYLANQKFFDDRYEKKVRFHSRRVVKIGFECPTWNFMRQNGKHKRVYTICIKEFFKHVICSAVFGRFFI